MAKRRGQAWKKREDGQDALTVLTGLRMNVILGDAVDSTRHDTTLGVLESGREHREREREGA